MKNEEEKVSKRDLVKGYGHIVIRKGYVGGKPALLERRISVRQILEGLSEGMTPNDFFDAYDIPAESVSEVLKFAAEFAGGQDVADRRKLA